jgi:hypothetical protein
MEEADSSLYLSSASFDRVRSFVLLSRAFGLFAGDHIPLGVFSRHHFELLYSNEEPDSSTNRKLPRGGE